MFDGMVPVASGTVDVAAGDQRVLREWTGSSRILAGLSSDPEPCFWQQRVTATAIALGAAGVDDPHVRSVWSPGPA
jgi:hypothetical protein